MKKATRSKRATSRKSSSKKPVQHALLLPFSFRRIVLITTCIALFVFVANISHRGIVTQSVAGVGITRGVFDQQTIDLPPVPSTGVVAYNVYYKEKSESKYIHSVRKLPTTIKTYTISYLKKNKEYQYIISGLNSSGKEIWWSEEKTFFSYQSM